MLLNLEEKMHIHDFVHPRTTCEALGIIPQKLRRHDTFIIEELGNLESTAPPLP
jgi:hypothetical protein